MYSVHSDITDGCGEMCNIPETPNSYIPPGMEAPRSGIVPSSAMCHTTPGAYEAERFAWPTLAQAFPLLVEHPTDSGKK